MSLLPRVVEQADVAFVFDATGDRPRLSYRKGVHSLALDPPAYLDSRLIAPLRIRASERAAIRNEFPTAEAANEEAGCYVGSICFAASNYRCQVTEEGRYLTHDALLFEAWTSGARLVRYTEGFGTAVEVAAQAACE